MYRYTQRTTAAFRRDAPTRLCYAALAAYAFWLYAFGPALALLRAELHFSYTIVGAYSALWAAGAAVSGVSFAALGRRLRRGTQLWCSGAAATAGAGLFAMTHTVALTLLGAALLGVAGTTLLTCTQAILSERHGERRDRALTESNVGAAACAVLAPLLLGLLQGVPGGWRVAMGLPVLVLAGLYLRYRHLPLPSAPAGHTSGMARLPLPCWLLATLVASGIAVEFCLVYFGAELLTATGLPTAQAATAMSGFYFGILSGRVGGAWLTRATERAVVLLWASLAVTAAGFLLFWLAGQPALATIGLFACGLGVANLYPLSVALTLAAAPGNGDSANGAIQLLGGMLVIAAPFLLGSLADHLGLHAAFAVEPALLGTCAVLLLAGIRLARLPGTRRVRPARPPVYGRVLGSGGGMEKEVLLAEVSTTRTARGNTRYVARDADGGEYSTFRDEIGERALRLQGATVRIEFHEEKRGQYRNIYLDGIEPARPGSAPAAATDPDEAAWRTAVEAAPWLVGEPGDTVPPEELYGKLKPFEEKVAEDIEQTKRHRE